MKHLHTRARRLGVVIIVIGCAALALTLALTARNRP
jgi:hypothetical protein